jgi:glycerol kinase
MEVDLSKKLVFPSIDLTNLRSYIVLWSEKEKKLVMIELTVPWETRCEEAYERKKAKYTEQLNQRRQRGLHTWLFPIEC